VTLPVLTKMEAFMEGTLHGDKLECADHSRGCRSGWALAFGGVRSLSRRPQANETTVFKAPRLKAV
jgi:hypothetical protein